MVSARHTLGSFLGGLPPMTSTPTKRTTKCDRTRAYLQSHDETWLTIETIAEAVGITVSLVHDCLSRFCREEHVERRFPTQPGRRQQPQEYRWRRAS